MRCLFLPPPLSFSLSRSPHALKPGAVEQRIVLTLRRTEKSDIQTTKREKSNWRQKGRSAAPLSPSHVCQAGRPPLPNAMRRARQHACVNPLSKSTGNSTVILVERESAVHALNHGRGCAEGRSQHADRSPACSERLVVLHTVHHHVHHRVAHRTFPSPLFHTGACTRSTPDTRVYLY